MLLSGGANGSDDFHYLDFIFLSSGRTSLGKTATPMEIPSSSKRQWVSAILELVVTTLAVSSTICYVHVFRIKLIGVDNEAFIMEEGLESFQKG